MSRSAEPGVIGDLGDKGRRDIRRGVMLIRCFWFAFLSPFLAEVLFAIGRNEASPAVAFLMVTASIIIWSGLVFGAAYFLLLLRRTRCPSCGYALLKNNGKDSEDYIPG
jgi:hypothetical protein